MMMYVFSPTVSIISQEAVRHWKSLLHHICGVHRWEEDNVEQRCKHRDYTAEEQQKRVWLTPNTPPYNALKAIVLDPFVLRDLKQMALFKHTGMYVCSCVYVTGCLENQCKTFVFYFTAPPSPLLSFLPIGATPRCF